MSHSHSSRIAWLKERGFLAEDRSITREDIGLCLWIDGHKGHRHVSFWLSVREGSAILHAPGKDVMTWQELQLWIEPPPEVVEVVKPLMGQRSLFDE